MLGGMEIKQRLWASLNTTLLYSGTCCIEQKSCCPKTKTAKWHAAEILNCCIVMVSGTKIKEDYGHNGLYSYSLPILTVRKSADPKFCQQLTGPPRMSSHTRHFLPSKLPPSPKHQPSDSNDAATKNGIHSTSVAKYTWACSEELPMIGEWLCQGFRLLVCHSGHIPWYKPLS